MRLASKIQRTEIEILADISFFFFLFTSFAFNHTKIGQAGFAFLIGSVMILMLSKRKIYNSFYFFFSMIFILYNFMITQIGISIDIETSTAMTQTLMMNFLFAFAMFNYLVIRNDMRSALRQYLRASLIFSILIVIISASAIFSSRLGSDVNLTLLGMNIEYNSNAIGMIAAFAYIVSLYECLSLSHLKRKLYFSGMVWFTIIVLLSGSRKSVFIILIGTALLAYILRPQKRTRNILIFIFMTFILYIFMTNIQWLYEIAGWRFEAIIDMLLGKEIDEGSMNSRLRFIDRGWEYFLERPWTGYGLDCFRHLQYGYGTYSHNNYIELLVSGGIIGFVLYYFPNALMYMEICNKSRAALDVFKMTSAMFLIQQALEYANVTYFERFPLMMLIFALASLKLHELEVKKSKVTLVNKRR